MELLKVDEVARMLRVPSARVYDLARQRVIPSVRMGRQIRVDRAALRRWIEAGGKPLRGGWRKAEPHESTCVADRRSP